jgi:eukaryotic-like serine/threonine-protein kinase
MSNKEKKFKKQIPDLTSFIDDISASEIDDENNLTPHASAFASNYIVGEVIATGGLKVVREVRDRKSGRYVAMAKLRHELISPSNNERFLREARVLASLEHTNIVPLYEINYDTDGIIFFTMKRLSGETLASILNKIKNDDSDYIQKYPLRKLLGIYIRVCEAISYAHSNGIVHLDIKPENIQISEYGEVSVIDWGMAKHVDDKNDLEYTNLDLPDFTPLAPNPTKLGSLYGTPGYMSPEQASKGSLKAEKPSDIYSLGATLYAILYKKHPYFEYEIDEVINKTKKAAEIEFPESINEKTIPSALRAIARKAMMPEPKNRYTQVSELKHDIELHLSDFVTHAENITISRILFLFLKRHYIGTIATSSVILIITLIAYFSLRTIQEKEEKISATSEDIVFGTIRKESEFRYAENFDGAIAHYVHLLEIGYDYPTFKYNLARLYAGNLELKKSNYYITQVLNSNSDVKDTEEFKTLKNGVDKFINQNPFPLNDKDAALFASMMPNIIITHAFFTINRNPNKTLIERLNNLKQNLLITNPPLKPDFNFSYEIKDNFLSIDISNNPRLTNKSALMGFRINHINLSNTNIGISQYFEYKSIQDSLKTLVFSRMKNVFPQPFLDSSNLSKLVLKNGKYEATNLRINPELKYLDVEGCDFADHFWVPSDTLEYFNIAFSKFTYFDTLNYFIGLKTLVVDKSMIALIPQKTLSSLERRGVEIIIKEQPAL